MCYVRASNFGGLCSHILLPSLCVLILVTIQIKTSTVVKKRLFRKKTFKITTPFCSVLDSRWQGSEQAAIPMLPHRTLERRIRQLRPNFGIQQSKQGVQRESEKKQVLGSHSPI